MQHILQLLWRRAWIIALVAVLAALGAFAVAGRQPKLYSATSQVHVTNPNSESLFDNANVQFIGEREVATQSELIQSPEVEAVVHERLGDRSDQIGKLSVSSVPDTDLINLAVSSQTPEVARDAANQYAEVYVGRRQDQVTQVLDQRAADLRAQSEKLDRDLRLVQEQSASATPQDLPALQAESASITRQIEDFNSRASQLEAEAAIRTGNVEIASRAELPEQPYAPTPRKDAALAAVLGLIASVGIILLFDRLDDRIRSPEQAEAAADLTVLGSIPIFAPERKRNPHHLPHGTRALVPPTSIHAEAYRTLRTSLRFAVLGSGPQVIMITSSSGSEGKSTVTANLAASLADSGLKVVVISADLRRPVVSGIFGIEDTEQGLSTTLVGETRATECLHEVPVGDGGRLWLLPAGPLPHNPAEILGSTRMQDLLDQLRNAGVDLVLIDSPPVLPVADALAIAQFVDGVILLAVPGQTRSRSLSESAQRLRRVGAELIGLVLNGVPLSGGPYSYYYYRHYGYHPYEADGTQRSRRDRSGTTSAQPSGRGRTSGTVTHT